MMLSQLWVPNHLRPPLGETYLSHRGILSGTLWSAFSPENALFPLAASTQREAMCVHLAKEGTDEVNCNFRAI